MEVRIVILASGKYQKRLLSFLGAAVIALALSFASHAQVAPEDEPKYAPDGTLLLPQGFETWIFVGSNLGLAYKSGAFAMTAREAARADVGLFHNIYITRSAYSQFIANGTFPDKTILVMQIFTADDKEPKGVLSKGVFNGKRFGVEVAVKNLHRPDGNATPWAYYDFTDPQDPSKTLANSTAFDDASCENCHSRHASTDNVWVQFYPTLRDRK
jgi:hypothetical protein